MGMSKNENEARIYTEGRESARIFLSGSISHYTTIRMYGAVEKMRETTHEENAVPEQTHDSLPPV